MLDDLIDEKAQQARSGNETAVHELADEVFNTAYFVELPSDVKELIKERVVRDELRHREGKRGGVEEDKIVLAINELARKLDAPDYAQTSVAQVRALRVRLMQGYPNFIAQETSDKKRGLNKRVGDSINPEMSPLEAVFVAGVLLQQKMLNEDFQHPPGEWEDKLQKKQLRKWEAGGQNVGGQTTPRIEMSTNARRNEMRRAITHGVSRMRLSELQNLPDRILDTLGIIR